MQTTAAEDPHHLEVVGVSKSYGDLRAVDDVGLAVRRGEVLCFLGPSGCGKTTLLNLIAGFERPDRGEIRLLGQRINDKPPNRRPTAMVFQSYALFPHMSVAENVGYGLRVRGERADVTAARTTECLDLLKLSGLEKRYPGELSGGQRQRVAVARALAVRPEILLLDEALSALDKNLRESMQVELSLLLRELGITAILVTHDQREAFALADRVVVMNAGRIVQDGRPSDLYANPKSEFVLSFLGHVNRLAVSLVDRGRTLAVEAPEGIAFECSRQRSWARADRGTLCLRSTDIMVAGKPTEVHGRNPGTLRLGSFLGSTQRYVVELGATEFVLETTESRSSDGRMLQAGDKVFLSFSPDRCFLTD